MWICGRRSGIGTGFFLQLRFPLPILIPPTAPHSSSIIWSWYNRPVVDAVPSGLSLTTLRRKVKSLCLTNYTLRHENVWGSGCIDPRILDLGEWSASRPGLFTSGELDHGTHWKKGWVGPITDLEDVKKRKILPLPRSEFRPLGRTARSQSL
jgi:hypothetical protein